MLQLRHLTVFALGLALGLSSPAQTITTAAANSTWGGTSSVARDSAGNLYIADTGNAKVYKVDRLGATTTIAGTGTAGYSGDGGPATSARVYATAVAVDTAGNVYIAEYDGNRIRKIAVDGTITTFAGTNRAGFSGDGGPASAAMIDGPIGMVFDSAGNLYFADWGNARIRKITPAGVISTVVGTGRRAFGGDGGPALLADINPTNLAFGPDGSLYIADDGRYGNEGNNRIRKVSPNGTITTIAGSATLGFSGDGGPATSAIYNRTKGVAVDTAGNVFISEWGGNRIRKVAPSGIVTTYAGTGAGNFSGDGGPALDATFRQPLGLLLDPQSNLYVADYNNRRIRKITVQAGPNITSALPAFMGKADFSSNTYLEIYGTNLATTTRIWTGSDFQGSNAPTAVDGVSVTVNNKPAFIYYVSPSQININTPDDDATGPVTIQVKNSLGLSNAWTANRARLSPTLQTVPQFSSGGRQYVVAETPDFKWFIGSTGLVSGISFLPANHGDTITIFALGCGPTNPPSQAGVVASQNAPLAVSADLRIGGIPATITYIGVVASTIGLYQINAIVPSVANGDQPIELIVDGVRNNQLLYLTVGNDILRR